MQPYDKVLDALDWTEQQNQAPDPEGLPYVTHEAALKVGGHSLRVYQLSNGQRVFNSDDFNEFFCALATEHTPQP